MKKSIEKNKKIKNIWKIAAIAFIILFSLFVVFAIARMYHFRSSLIAPSKEQADSAIGIALKSLNANGNNESNYKIEVSHNIKRLKVNGSSADITQVSMFNDSTSHLFLININSGQVLMHSRTDVYGFMMDSKMHRPGLDERINEKNKRGTFRR